MFESLTEPKTFSRLSILAVIVGAFFLKSAFSIMAVQDEAAKWPAAVAHIDDVEIVKRGEKSYTPTVKYMYAVKGHTYTSGYIWLSGHRDFVSEAEAMKAVPAVGAVAQVRYDPHDPEHCTLRLDAQTGLLHTSAGRWSIGLLSLGVIGFIGSFMVNRSREAWRADLP